MDGERFAELAAVLRGRIADLAKTEPIRYRRQAGGDYGRGLRLEPGREVTGTRGFGLHVRGG